MGFPQNIGGDTFDALDRRTRYDKTRQALVSERNSGFDEHWRELGDWLMPRRTRFWTGDRNKQNKRNQNIIDSTARFSARTLSSGLHSGLTSPARPWMKLTTPDQSLAERPNVKKWLHVVSQRMLTIFGVSNIYNVLPLVYLDMGVFGTGAMSMLPDSRDLFRCVSYPLGSYAIAQDERGATSTFVRDYEMTVRQLVGAFGVDPHHPKNPIDWSRISLTVKKLWEAGDYNQGIGLTWIVTPNELQDVSRFPAKYLPFASCHYERGSDERKFLRESGYKTFPIMAPRWDVTGEDSYGTDCPGMTALGDVRQLQSMQRKKGQAIAKQVDPPLVGPSSLRTQKTSLLPGDVTYADTRDGMQGLRPIHDINLNLRDMTADIGQVQYRIQRAFFEDLFLMLARSDDTRGAQPPTAREVDERHEEKLLALGPVLERTTDELLDPIVDRAYQMMEDAGLLPPAPPELDNVQLRVEYTSLLAQAQKLIGVTGQDRFLQTALGLVQIHPDVVDKVDFNQVVDNYGDMLGVDPRIVRSNDEANAISAKRQQAQAQTQAAQNAALAAKAARDASQAPVTGDSMLASAVAGAQQGGIPQQATGSAPAVPAGA